MWILILHLNLIKPFQPLHPLLQASCKLRLEALYLLPFITCYKIYKMKQSLTLLLLFVLATHQSTPVSIFYCGFGQDYCGQSNTDDVNPNVKFVILAFANPGADGTVAVDDANFPTTLVKSWQNSGKKVLISVGGQNGNWGFVFATTTNVNNFINSLAGILVKYNLDGVDLDIESYNAAPQTVVDTLAGLR